ncbi:hypothetical protein EYF80_038522 [Liparis tanakae]|uniref:Uncharacterized protein n=1 Tax=Liparis tanakae TaxID=230148 RepID=A0A4Z2GDI9_9TELE|nr:hypothetical protein EYF80_038522 [Liparis tanakae]
MDVYVHITKIGPTTEKKNSGWENRKKKRREQGDEQNREARRGTSPLLLLLAQTARFGPFSIHPVVYSTSSFKCVSGGTEPGSSLWLCECTALKYSTPLGHGERRKIRRRETTQTKRKGPPPVHLNI